jgi:hypothetical protein
MLPQQKHILGCCGTAPSLCVGLSLGRRSVSPLANGSRWPHNVTSADLGNRFNDCDASSRGRFWVLPPTRVHAPPLWQFPCLLLTSSSEGPEYNMPQSPRNLAAPDLQTLIFYGSVPELNNTFVEPKTKAR